MIYFRFGTAVASLGDINRSVKISYYALYHIIHKTTCTISSTYLAISYYTLYHINYLYNTMDIRND